MLGRAAAGVELPALYVAADKASLRGQRGYLILRGGQLLCLLIAAIGGATTLKAGAVDWAGIVVALAFLSALGLQYRLGSDRPEKMWYDGRAAAESVKNLAWRYAMKAEPFLSGPDPDGALIAQLRETLAELHGIPLGTSGPEQVTDWMRTVRAMDLDARKARYLGDRLDDQWRWYTDKADDSRKMTDRWRIAIGVLAIVGALGGGAKAFGAIEIDVLGLVATAIGATTAWLQTRQHETLAVAYGLAAQELAAVRSLAHQPTDDQSWSRFVNDAEAAISREHILWRASRTVRRPSGA